MPVVGIPVNMLLARLGTELGREVLIEKLQQLGCDVEGFATLRRFRCGRCDNILEITETENPPVACDRCGADFRQDAAALHELGESDVIRMELLAVRPDMFDPGGLARVLRHYLELQDEPASYAVAPPEARVVVDPSLARPESFRPSIACAIVRNITLDDDVIKVVMKLQENLHWALGRDRKHASIGVYDLDALQGPDFSYRSVGPEELRFTPLGCAADDPSAQLTPRQVLQEHPKGKHYARLLERFERYPLLCDAAGQVLSMPPIINSEQTRVVRRTRNFFIDVTGSAERIVNKALNILVTSLAELDPAIEIAQVTIAYPDREVATPDLTPQTVTLQLEQATRLIGLPLDAAQVGGCLRRMGHLVREEPGNGTIAVGVPAYRNDIMHPVDLIEDVAIGYGYHNIEPSLVPTMTVGEELPVECQSALARRALTGLGYLEVLTLILSSEEQQYDALRLPRRDDCVLIENPISVEQTIVRTSLLPGLLDTFSANTDHEMPQRLFELGNVSCLATDAETGARERRHVAAAVSGPRCDYAEIRAACEALLRELGWELAVEADDRGLYIPGRGATVFATRAGQRQQVGTMGEVHPEVLERFKLVQPVALFELELAALAGTRPNR